MKTEPNQLTNPLGACGTDTNPRKIYEVTVHSTVYRYVVARVKAQSEAEAENLAEQSARKLRDSKWGVSDCDLYAHTVEEVNEGEEGNE